MRKKVFAFALMLMLAALPFSSFAQGEFELDQAGTLVSGDNVLRIKAAGEYKISLLNAQNIKVTDKNQNEIKILKTYYDFDGETLFVTLGESLSAADEYEISIDKKVFNSEDNLCEKFAVTDGIGLENGISVEKNGDGLTFSARVIGGENIAKVTFVCTVQKDGVIVDTFVKNTEYDAQNEFSLECSEIPDSCSLTVFVNITDKNGRIITCGRIEQYEQ